MNTFTIGSSIRFGWETFKKRPIFFAAATIAVFAASWIISYVLGLLSQGGAATLLATLANMIVSILISMGTAAFFLRAHDAPESVSFADYWHPRPFWKFVVGMLLTGLIVAVPAFALLLLATFVNVNLVLVGLGVYALAILPRVLFVQYLVIDTGAGPVDAVRKSFRMTRSAWLQLVGLFVVSILLNILGALALVVGLLVTTPVTTLALVHAYRTLSAPAPTV
jgi:uncharacterized membrane protein